MKDTYSPLDKFTIFCTGIILLSIIPLTVIWALNTLFVLNIPYALNTVVAVLILLALNTGVSKK